MTLALGVAAQVVVGARRSYREPSRSHYVVPIHVASPRQLGDGSLSCGTGPADPRISG